MGQMGEPTQWMGDIAAILRERLGPAASKIPTRALPDVVLRLAALFDPSFKTVVPMLGRRNRHSSEKARRILGWSPRTAEETAVDCANSLIALKVV